MVQPEVRLAAVVACKNGLHARPAIQLAETAQRFASTIQIVKDDTAVDGKSVLQLMTLFAKSGTPLMVIARGADANDAALAIAEIIETEETTTDP
ncbi:MAG: HPr family phosphocarrier protein [Planctomycetaceae bacterium]|jgi:phosphotransferase system HPr (HPr) family protein|nr:HPr family phosphocarrier protein [Planctomycetaceae bacterium]